MKKNTYDFIISELIHRASANVSPYSGPYLEVTSSLPFNNQAPFTTNTTATFTSVLKNIPVGYNVKANTHEISYPIMVPNDTNSSSTLIGSPVPIIFTTIGDVFTVNVTITLEKALVADIVVTSTFTVTAIGAIFYGTRSVDNDFTLPGLSSTVYLESNQKVLLNPVVNEYVYFVFPTGANIPFFFRDRNGLVIESDSNNFTTTNFGGYIYLVMNWNTTIPQYSSWEIVYNY
jgi:hypothetical protein